MQKEHVYALAIICVCALLGLGLWINRGDSKSVQIIVSNATQLGLAVFGASKLASEGKPEGGQDE